MKVDRKIHFNVRDVYIYVLKLILFVTIILCGTSFVNSLVDYFIPLDYIDSFETYKNNHTFESSANYTDEEMKTLYNDYVSSEKTIQSSYKLNSLISNLIILLGCFIALFFLRNKSLVLDTEEDINSVNKN